MCGIYKITNLINEKVYIGQSVDINYRFNNHKSESFNPKSNAYNTAIHRAIRKYGVENFSFEVIEECTKELLSEREIYWIAYYNSYGNGYNLTSGGEGVPSIDRQAVFNLWDDGLSIDEISKIISCEKHTAICILKSYELYSNEESYKRGRKNAKKKACKQVLQYDLAGNFIAKYNSVTEAANAVKTNKTNISSVLSGRQLSAGGYQWIRDGEVPPGVCRAKSQNDKKEVIQFDLNHNFIARYASIAEAAKSVGLLRPISITRACKNKKYTAAGYRWEYSADVAAH